MISKFRLLRLARFGGKKVSEKVGERKENLGAKMFQ